MNSIRALAPRGFQGDVFFRNIVCLSALVTLIWEYSLTLTDEYQYIWRGFMNRVKVLYLFSRYSTLAIHASNIYIVFGPLSQTPVPRFACTAWFLLLTIGACLLLASIDALVMLRVYLLYGRSVVVAVFLTALMFLQFGLVAMCTSRTLHIVPFSNTCDVLQTPHDVVYIMGGVILTQVVLLFLTLAKRKVAFGASPLVHMVVHDGARVFILIVSLWMTIIPYFLFMQVSKPHIIFVWPITLMSIATCRLIMHMQKLPLEVLSSSTSNSTDAVVLTTYLASLESFHAATILPSSAETSIRTSLSSSREYSHPTPQQAVVSDLPNTIGSRCPSNHAYLSQAS